MINTQNMHTSALRSVVREQELSPWLRAAAIYSCVLSSVQVCLKGSEHFVQIVFFFTYVFVYMYIDVEVNTFFK